MCQETTQSVTLPVANYVSGYHLHLCEPCGFVWKHGDDKHGLVKEHECPNCGEPEFRKHKWDEKWTAADKALRPTEEWDDDDRARLANRARRVA